MVKSKLKSLISTILIVALVLNTATINYATGSDGGGNDVNVTDASFETKDPSLSPWQPTEYEGFSAIGGLQQPVQIGARVSLYDIETQNRIGTLDFVDNYEEYKNYRRISKYSKTQIIEFNGNIEGTTIENNISENSQAILDDNLAKVSITFPSFLDFSFATGGGGTAENIRKHYEQDEKVKELIKNFPNEKDIWDKGTLPPPPSITSSENFILYEDELSNVYDYNSISSDDDTRKITGTANISSTGFFHIFNILKVN